MDQTDIVLAVQKALTEEERNVFLQKFTWLNPRWQGAHVADVLQALDERDEDLSVVEPLYEAHGGEVPEPGLIAAAARVVVTLKGSAPWEEVRGLVERTRKVLARA